VNAVQLCLDPQLRYVSRSKQLGADAIDGYVRETIAALRAEHAASGLPFTQYHGCSEEDEQIVEVCLPTASGDIELPGQEIAFTVARGAECEYPEILKVYDAVVAFAAEHGRAVGGPPRETYVTDPGSPNPEMEVAFPLLGV